MLLVDKLIQVQIQVDVFEIGNQNVKYVLEFELRHEVF